MAERHSDSPHLKPMTPEELREWRISHGLTQQQLAKLLGVSQRGISNWETGDRRIPPYLHFTLMCLEKEGHIPTKQ